MIIISGTTVDTSDAQVMAGYGLNAFKGSVRPVIQNLGPGVLYIGTSSTNITTVGLEVVVNAVYELPATLVEGAGRLVLAASGGNCDVRMLNVG